MLLADLLSQVSDIVLKSQGVADTIAPLDVEYLVADSRYVRPKSLFVAIPGFRADGHDFISEAVANGAVALVVERLVEPEPNVPCFIVKNSRRALGLLASAFYGFPSRQLRVIGITGTNGKTTTTRLVHHLLSHAGFKTGLIGSPDIIVGDHHLSSDITTPDALELQSLMHQMVTANCTHVVMEVSSHGLELERVAGISFDIAVITNIDTDHLDLHKSQENYIATKQRLFRMLGHEQVGIINLDDPSEQHIRPITNAATLLYGLSDDAQIQANSVSRKGRGGSAFSIRFPRSRKLKSGLYASAMENDATATPETTAACTIDIPGLHNISNALAAAGVAFALGIDAATAATGLATFSGVRRRFEVIYDQDFAIIDDYAHNAGSVTAVLNAIDPAAYRKIVLVTAVRGNRGVAVNLETGEAMVAFLRNWPRAEVIVTDSCEAVTPKDKVLQSEEKAFLSTLVQQPHPVRLFAQLRDAIDSALQLAKRGDLVLLIGAQGMDQGAKIAQSLLAGRAAIPR